MIFPKKEVNYKNKKYLLVIFILMIVAAIGLSIANLFEDKNAEKKEKAIIANEINNNIVGAQNYSTPIIPELKKTDRILGNKNARLKIFVYEDYSDAFSANLATTIDRLVKERGAEIAFVLRPFISSPESSYINALALDCAGDKWQALRREMMTSLESNSNRELEDMANDAGINDPFFFNCMAQKNEKGREVELKQDVLSHEIIGSPTIFVASELVLGARPYENYLDSNGDENEGLNDLIERVLEVDKKD